MVMDKTMNKISLSISLSNSVLKKKYFNPINKDRIITISIESR